MDDFFKEIELVIKCSFNELTGVIPDEILQPIVRCRDCDYRCHSWNGHEPNFIDNWFCAYTGGHEVEPDGFCKWGERRGDTE